MHETITQICTHFVHMAHCTQMRYKRLSTLVQCICQASKISLAMSRMTGYGIKAIYCNVCRQTSQNDTIDNNVKGQ